MQAALTSTITQGIGVVTGLQSSFSWKGVVASAAGAGVGTLLDSALPLALSGEDFGGKLNTVQIASDAFGNALGYAFAPRVQASAQPPLLDVEAQYRASSYAANAYSADDYGSNVGSPNPDFYSDTEANQDFAREQLRVSTAQTPSVNPTRIASAAIGSSSVSAHQWQDSSDFKPDGVYIDDNGTRHLRVNISGFTRPDPITQAKAAILDRLDQWGADAVAHQDGLSLSLGGLASTAIQTFMPDSEQDFAKMMVAGPLLSWEKSDPVAAFKEMTLTKLDEWGADAVARDDTISLVVGGGLSAFTKTCVPDNAVELGFGLVATPVLGKGISLGVSGLNALARRSAVTSWLAGDLTKLPTASSQMLAGFTDEATQSFNQNINQLKNFFSNASENLLVRIGGLLRLTEEKITSDTINKPKDPLKFAESLQGSENYPGVDGFRNITLKQGKIIFGGAPGQSNFYTTASAIKRSNENAQVLFGGLQVSPHPLQGYRPGVTAYEVLYDTPAAFGITLANPQHGTGRLPQLVIEDFESVLRPLYSIPLKK